MLTEEDTLASSLNFRLDELVTHNLRAEARVWRPRHLIASLPLSILATLAVIAGPVAFVAALVPGRGILWEPLAVLLAVAGSLAIASAGSWIWMRWTRSREMIFAELMLWGWIRRFWVERRLARTRDLFESARASGSPVSIELLTQLSDQLQEVDPYLHGHSRRVSSYAGRIARELRLSASEIGKIEAAALVHDVGKIYTPQEILNKPGRLTDREFAIVKLHPRDGAELLGDVGDAELTAIVLHHHERLDGDGYPDGIGGEEIPLGARIIAVADTFDAITSTRPYRPPRSHKEAIDILSRESGKQLDADVVAAFLACYAARRLVARSAFAGAVPERLIAAFKGSSTGLGAHSLAQTLPALGLAGVLAASPALRPAGVDGQGQVTRSAARLAGDPAPIQADRADAGDARTGRLGFTGGNPQAKAGPRGTGGTDPSTKPRTGTSVPQPPPSSAAAPQSPSPSGPQTPGPGSVTPGSPPAATQPPHTPPPTTTPTPTTPSPEAPATPVVAPSTPSVKISVPPVSTPVVTLPTVTAEGVSTPSVTVPSITTPSVTAPGLNVPSATVPSVTLPRVTLPRVNVAGVEL
jgi:HD-GYP domain-containing protein (c-di-GMP phosphodiesterase class II)